MIGSQAHALWTRFTPFVLLLLIVGQMCGAPAAARSGEDSDPCDYEIEGKISRKVLENYLSRSITMAGMLHGQGNLDDHLAMLRRTGAKYLGRAACLWGQEDRFLACVESTRESMTKVAAADPDFIAEACVFEVVTPAVNQVEIPGWVFQAFDRPVESRTFRYDDMVYLDLRNGRNWRSGGQIPDVSRPETRLWLYYQAASYIDAGCEAIHFGQPEIMNKVDPDNEHWRDLIGLVRQFAARKARRRMVVCNAHVPSGGLMHEGNPLLDFHAFPLRIKELPEHPKEAVLDANFYDAIYGHSKGGLTFSGWSCEHLPYLVEFDNYGSSPQPGAANLGRYWVWGYDEITWFAMQSDEYRERWLKYAWNWVRRTDPNGYLEMPGSREAMFPDKDHDQQWYFAVRPTTAIPAGTGDEEVIRAIWAADAESRQQAESLPTTTGPAP